jgi:hypothetical protein
LIDDERLHREIDRELGPQESERLRLDLALQPEARERFGRLARLVRALDAQPAAEPPVDFVQAIMRAVRGSGLAAAAVPPGLDGSPPARANRSALEAVRRWLREVQPSPGVGQRMLLAASGLALVTFGYFAVRGFPPVGRGAEGTAGALREYPEASIRAGEVDAREALAREFMRTAAFDRLLKDPSARIALADASVRAALSSPGLTASVLKPPVAGAAADPQVDALLAQPAVAAALANPNVAGALAEPGFAAALTSPRFVAALSEATAGSRR